MPAHIETAALVVVLGDLRLVTRFGFGCGDVVGFVMKCVGFHVEYRPRSKTIMIKYYYECFVQVSGAPPKTDGLYTKYYYDIKHY